MRSIEMGTNVIQLEEFKKRKRKESAERVRAILGSPTLKSELIRFSVEVSSNLASLFERAKSKPETKVVNFEDLKHQPVA